MTQTNDIRLQRLMENQFVLRVACHDMANPLAIIMTALSICQSSDDIEEIHSFLERMRRAANEQRNILRELRDAKGILATDNDLRDERVNAKEIFADAIELFAEDIKEKNLKVNFSCAVKKCFVDADSFLFEKVFARPLVANAIKFSRDGGAIDISVAERGKNLEIIVRDEGVGIAQEWITKIFSPDFKDTRTHATGETGIGYALPLMKMFIERIGGEVGLTSNAESTPKTPTFTEVKCLIPLSEKQS